MESETKKLVNTAPSLNTFAGKQASVPVMEFNVLLNSIV